MTSRCIRTSVRTRRYNYRRVPPLLYAAAYFTPLRELRPNVGQISLLSALRDTGTINDEVLRRIERELDLEDSRLEI